MAPDEYSTALSSGIHIQYMYYLFPVCIPFFYMFFFFCFAFTTSCYDDKRMRTGLEYFQTIFILCIVKSSDRFVAYFPLLLLHTFIHAISNIPLGTCQSTQFLGNENIVHNVQTVQDK